MYEMKRKYTWSALKTGWVLTIAIFLLFLTVFFSGNASDLFIAKGHLTVWVENVNGLRSGAPVWLYGVEVGNVKSVTLTDSGARIDLSILQRHLGIIHQDATARVATMGLLGDKYIEVTPGTAAAALVGPGDTIGGFVPTEFDEILESGVGSLDKIDSLVARMDSFLAWVQSGEGSLNQLVTNPGLYNTMNDAARAISLAARDLRTAQGSLRQFIDNPELYDNLNDAAQRLSSILNQVGNGNGIVGELTSDGELSRGVNETIQSVNSLIADIKKNPKRYFSFELF